MSSENKEKSRVVFSVGSIYRAVNYETDISIDIEILHRKGKWLTILIEGKEMEVRAFPVVNPYSESILLDNYSPIFSYNYKNNPNPDLDYF